jgi:Domain of unknown function (DUF4349)/Putative zinc-finger
MHPIEPEELMAYLDGELAPERASEAAHHLSHCHECQSAAGEMQNVSRRLLEWQIEEPGSRVERAVNSARPPERRRPAWRRGVPWIAGLAAACILLLLSVPGPRVKMNSPAKFTSTDREARMMQEAQGRYGSNLSPRFEPLPLSAPPNGPATVTRDKVLTRGPLLIRTAQITLTTPDFAKARASVEEILKRHGGHIGNLSIGSPADSGQSFQATLRVPVDRLDAAMAEIRRLGRVETEQQGGEEVTQQMVDLEARLANSRNTEQRLADILRRSAGKIADVLAAEKEIDRVRGEIERMEADRKNLGDRVNFATLDVRINEEFKAHLAVSAPSTLGQLRNSAVAGYRNVADSLTGIAMYVLSYGPALVMWAAILFFPARYAWRRLRRSGP